MRSFISIIAIILFLPAIAREEAAQGYISDTLRVSKMVKSGPLKYDGKSNFTITGKEFSNTNQIVNNGNILMLFNCTNVTIVGNFFNKSTAGNDGGGAAIYLSNCSNIRIENNLFANTERGVLISRCPRDIKVIDNHFLNMKGKARKSGQIFQAIECKGPGFEIRGNRAEYNEGQSDCEDIINLFASSGTAASPIIIRNNILRGGGSSLSGGGIVAGDGTGDYVNIDSNILINPGQYGIGVAGGNHISITNNKVYSAKTNVSNVGIMVWNQQDALCGGITVTNNRVNWTNSKGARNDYWNKGNCSECTCDPPFPTTEVEITSAVPSRLIDMVSDRELGKLKNQ